MDTTNTEISIDFYTTNHVNLALRLVEYFKYLKLNAYLKKTEELCSDGGNYVNTEYHVCVKLDLSLVSWKPNIGRAYVFPRLDRKDGSELYTIDDLYLFCLGYEQSYVLIEQTLRLGVAK